MAQLLEQRSKDESEYNQISFIGGMNLLLDDTHLQPNQYRIGFNIRNRYDRLDLIPSSVLQTLPASGVIQEYVTFGNYQIIFISGLAYYKLYNLQNWNKVNNFHMSESAPRFWVESVPVSTTNYLRIASTANGMPDSRGAISVNNISGAAQGNLPGLLVQDNINQPQFIFIDFFNNVNCRTTQSFDKWSITFTDATNTVVVDGKDLREYVPIGNQMKYVDGILYIASPDGSQILRSVSGRPLDFVVNVCNVLANNTTQMEWTYTPLVGSPINIEVPAFTMSGGGAFFTDPNTNTTSFVPGGDAYTTSYSVGVGPINAFRALADGSLFVAAGNANFSVSKNMTQNAPTIFGEYTFIRKFLFNANCLSDRAIIDTIGDTRFIDLTGVRSFNAISQTQNEGRNSVFTSTIQGAFTDPRTVPPNQIVQDPNFASAILFNDFEFYAVNTLFGYAIAVYDTVNQCWVGFDINQTNGKRIKKLVKIELAVQVLYAITEDNQLYQLYAGPNTDPGSFRTIGVTSGILWAGQTVKMANPKIEIKPAKFRIILNNITQNCTVNFTPYIDNRMSVGGTQTRNITYTKPSKPTTGIFAFGDVDTNLKNLLFTPANAEQGWKIFALISWTGGSITQFEMETTDITPQNPAMSQSTS